jgi:hypothetical protein
LSPPSARHAQCLLPFVASLAAQFDAYEPFPDLAVNGKQTLAENIADLAGLLAAYDVGGQARSSAERFHRRPAVLPRFGTELGGNDELQLDLGAD